MPEIGKFYVLLIMLTAGVLLLIPVCLLPSPAVAAPPDPPSSAPPSDSVLPSAPTPDLRNEAFLVLQEDGETVSAISQRDFLIYTLAAEMLPSFEPEALKAQVVASYTYFCYEKAAELASPTAALHGADFSDTPLPYPTAYTEEYWRTAWGDEVFEACYPRLAEAVDAVAGEQILYDGKPILAAYHAISGGVTELPEVVWAGAFPYLQSVASPADALAPDYQTSVIKTPEELQAAVADVENLVLGDDPSAWLGEPSYSAAGTVLSLPIGGISLSGRDWRSRLDLRSACFSAVYADGQFTFTVQGHGHGVGMSQYGAQALAQDGYSYREILQYYYTDVVVE